MIYFAEHLATHHPKVFVQVFAALDSHGVEVKLLDARKNVWARDYMPVRTGDHFTKFVYKTFGHGEYDCLRIPRDCWLDFAPELSRIVVDGGNVVQCDSCVLMTKAIFRNNPKIKSTALVCAIETLFQKRLVLLPMEVNDHLGHSDGIVHHLGADRVFLNDYSAMGTKVHTKYQLTVERILSNANLEPVIFPYAYHHCPKMSETKFRERYPEADDYNPAVGYYINILDAGPVVLLPAFGFPEDAAALEMARKHCGKPVVPIECFDLAMLGGCVRCCSWEYP